MNLTLDHYVEKIYYSVTEARTVLEEIRPIMGKLIAEILRQKLKKEIRIQYKDPFRNFIETIREGERYHRTQKEIFTLLGILAEKGAIVKDANLGIIDFYAWYDEREICLCYRFGEPSVNWWHEVDEGFRDRKSVTLLGEVEVEELT